MTLKGKQVLSLADVVVYDRLISPHLLSFAPARAERLYVGKASSAHSLPQEQINKVLAEKCSAGNIVVRLKGGDPFLFGRGGEEALYLAGQGCPFEIVPGITSAIAAPAYAGIPVTHRGKASSVAFITGHEKPGKAESSIRWKELAGGIDTLVVLMGIENLPAITKNLLAAGRPAATPAALVRSGSLPEQFVLTATLGDIEQKAREQRMQPPAVLVIGAVVDLHEKLAWAEKLPLWGRRIVVTRPAAQSADFIEKLQALGAAVLVLPAIEIKKEPDQCKLHQSFEKLHSYQWLIFTSRNSVDIFCDELLARGLDLRSLYTLKLCAIGPATADCLRARGIMADIVPEDYRAEGLLAELKGRVQTGDAALLPRAAGSRDILPNGLAALGVRVDEVITYQARPPAGAQAEALAEIQKGRVDIVTFTSSSTVTGFASLVGPGHMPKIAASIPAACIGPITAATAREHGFAIAAEAKKYTMAGLFEEVCSYFSA